MTPADVNKGPGGTLNISAHLDFSEQLRLAAGLQVLQSLTPKTVLRVQQNTICLVAKEPLVGEVKLKSVKPAGSAPQRALKVQEVHHQESL